MMNSKTIWILFGGVILFGGGVLSCKKSNPTTKIPPTTPASALQFSSLLVNGKFNGFTYRNVDKDAQIIIAFSKDIKASSVNNALIWKDLDQKVNKVARVHVQKNTLEIQCPTDLNWLSKNQLSIGASLQAEDGAKLINAIDITIYSAMDSSDKMPRISSSELLDLVQEKHFNYFWKGGHITSGMALERNTDNETVTTGGTGFGLMGIPVAVNKGFVSRDDGLARVQKIVQFLGNADKFHGTFPHWINGSTGKVIPFSAKDDGADLVETSFLMEGLLTVRQFFDGKNTTESTLRNQITALYNAVEWNWFRKNNENVLYWHWSPNYGWDINLPIRGWNECLITYVLAAASPNFGIDKEVYNYGWAQNSGFINDKNFFNIKLPLGSGMGGPLFFTHYSFLGLNPNGLKDRYADYGMQTKNQAAINYAYCKANPMKYSGYSDEVWGLTASDIPNGYSASSPNNDLGVIAPTAALASFPYTPEASIKALEFYYYKLGDKLWGDYGFYDAFSIHNIWFSNTYLAIDQLPIVIMIENYRTQQLWKLFMSCPEIKQGLNTLQITSANIY